VAGLAVIASPTHAATQRTFVASTGADGNPCSIAQPCRSFNFAIAQTNADGEVMVLDTGMVTVTDSDFTNNGQMGVRIWAMPSGASPFLGV